MTEQPIARAFVCRRILPPTGRSRSQGPGASHRPGCDASRGDPVRCHQPREYAASQLRAAPFETSTDCRGSGPLPDPIRLQPPGLARARFPPSIPRATSFLFWLVCAVFGAAAFEEPLAVCVVITPARAVAPPGFRLNAAAAAACSLSAARIDRC